MLCSEHDYECSYNRDVRKRGRKRKGQMPIERDTANAANSSGDSAGLYAEPSRDHDALQNIDEHGHTVNEFAMQTSSHDVLMESVSIEAIAATSTWADPPAVQSVSPGEFSGRLSETWANGTTNSARQTVLSAHRGLHERVRTSSSAGNLPGEYACLAALLPHIEGVIRPQLAYQLLQLYFAPPEGTLFHNASPYVLTPVLRRQSVLNPASTRKTTPALLATMIWVSAQTASLPQLLAPGSRANICCKLQDLVFKLLHDRDLDNWQRVSGESFILISCYSVYCTD